MLLFYGGGEVVKFRTILAEFGSLPISVSFLGLNKSSPAVPDYTGKILLDSGAFAMNKSTSSATFEEAYEASAQYMNFVKANIDDVFMVCEFDARQLDLTTVKQSRSDFYAKLPKDKFMPIWHPEHERDELEALCSSYPVVGVSQEDIHGDKANVPLFNQMISRYDVKLHGVGITSKKLLESVKWSSASSTAWLSTTRYGETFVWTGRELLRYPKSYKDRARRTHRTLFIDNGFDYTKIENDDPDELLRLSAWSWQRYVESLTKNPVTPVTANTLLPLTEQVPPEVGILSIPERKEKINVRATSTIPIMVNAVPDEDSVSPDEPLKPIVNIRSESMRVCDSCFLKDKCPGFEPNSTCLYNIPIEIRTKSQLDALEYALIEMQSQRVLFMKMAEDLSGGYSDPNLSSEIDRSVRMIRNKHESSKNMFSMTMTASESTGPGFFQKAFGVPAAAKIRELDAPLNADELIMSSTMGSIIDADIVDE